ncbi:MAG: DEAD/DEAH box helicase family protein [Deltaproteobacteria bacterium]|nr:DEAD/DEAH box helicase family protein [Deltaproteobacteria bacterium]
MPPPRLAWDRGTLLWDAGVGDLSPPGFQWDDRIRKLRAPGVAYREAVEWLRAERHPFEDAARAWAPLADLVHHAPRASRPYQAEAVTAWCAAGRRGVVVLPTGSGKTWVAECCIADTRRPTLVVVPTIDLLAQWAHRLATAFALPIGVLGGGSHEICDLTVSTYASAYLHVEHVGNRFALVIFDEVHHLPAERHAAIAEGLLAPFRLGLSATPERADEGHRLLDLLVGPEVYRREIRELSGRFLAPYETVRLEVHLDRAERQAYAAARQVYRSFVALKRIDLRKPDGWQRFLQVASRSRAGRAAFQAWREARAIAHGTGRKLDLLEDLLAEEAGRPTLVFTDDNATAYRISREMLIPCITHETPARERETILAGLGDGTYRAVVTSRVLNEGVDLPAVEIGVVVSGSGSVREHVQRLGRILRPGPGKQAILYELVTADTAEERTSDRRRDHEAYDA